MFKGRGLAALCAVVLALPVSAQQTRIGEDRARVEFSINGRSFSITREGPACPPRCLQPMRAVSGVGTVGELEVMDFLELFVARGRGLLVDIRLPDAFGQGTIPAAVNVPVATLQPGNIYRDDLLEALGARGSDFSGAYDLVLFGDGPDDSAVTEALGHLLQAGYPADKLKYYRGGALLWRQLGLTLAQGG